MHSSKKEISENCLDCIISKKSYMATGHWQKIMRKDIFLDLDLRKFGGTPFFDYFFDMLQILSFIFLMFTCLVESIRWLPQGKYMKRMPPEILFWTIILYFAAV